MEKQARGFRVSGIALGLLAEMKSSVIMEPGVGQPLVRATCIR
jgi:hypothetical protein